MNDKYKKLLQKILDKGDWLEGRNGKTLQIPSYSFTIDDMAKNHKLTIRKMFYKGVLGEFNTLIDPYPLTNVQKFVENGCNYWGAWAGENGELNLDYHNMLHPQLEHIIEQIKEDPSSRRHTVQLWNPENAQFTTAFNSGDSLYNGKVVEHPLYPSWQSQKSRCTSKTNAQYQKYGGRGITMSKEFQNFKTWLGYIEKLPNKKSGYSLDRQDNEKGYERGNIVWASYSDQNINRRVNKNNSTGFVGVSPKGKKFQCNINKSIHLGTFKTAEEAALARDAYIVENNLNHKLSRLSELPCNRVLLYPLSLHCCWSGLTFTVQESMLHLVWVQRSVDTAIGLPSDVYLAYLFMQHVADLTGLEIGSCMFALSNVHLYEEHIEGVKEMLKLPEEDYGKLIKFKLKA